MVFKYKIYVPNTGFFEDKFLAIVDSMCINLRTLYDLPKIYIRDEICYLRHNYKTRVKAIYFSLRIDVSESFVNLIKQYEEQYYFEGELEYEVSK